MRVKNANQHPGYVQMKPHKSSAPADEPKVKKVAAKAAKLAKATAKEVSTACASKYEQDAMEREDMLDATPHPNFNSTTSCCNTVPASNPSTPNMVSKSDMDTNEMNPNKGTYKPGSTTGDDLADDFCHLISQEDLCRGSQSQESWPKHCQVKGCSTLGPLHLRP